MESDKREWEALNQASTFSLGALNKNSFPPLKSLTLLLERRTSSNKSPIFPMPETQHFSDYGFDPQIDYFQVFFLFISLSGFNFPKLRFLFWMDKVLEEAKKHKKEESSASHFTLQKPISRDDLIRTSLHKKKKKRWFFWKNTFLFFKCRKWPISAGEGGDTEFQDGDVHMARARNFRAGSISGPVYVTESRSGSTTPYRTVRPSSEFRAGTLSPAIPYLSLRELNMGRQQRITTSSTSGPLYLVTW